MVEKTAQLYEVDIEPDESDFDGVVTVTVRANAVRERFHQRQGNTVTDEDFDVDTKGPVLEEATVDEDELILTYDEDLDENSEPSPGDFTIEVDGTVTSQPSTSVDDEVTLTLDDEVSGGDDVTIDYDPGTNPIQDELGNEASSLTDEEVENITADDLPSAPRNLTATADGRRGSTWSGTSRPTTEAAASPATGSRYRTRAPEIGPIWSATRTTPEPRTPTPGSSRGPGSTTASPRSTATARARGRDIANATTEGGTPGEPRNLTAVESGSSRINLSWSAPISDGGSRITGYKIEVSSNGGRTWSVRVSDTRSSSTTYAHRGLESGTTWHYRVSAINSEGPGEPSNVASATTDIGAPRAPTSLSAVCLR